MKRILIAPDSFKGSLSAKKFCDIASEAIRSVDAEIITDLVPMADGGEGTVEALVHNTGGRLVDCDVLGPLLRPRKASYGILGDNETAIIEMAEASGLTMLTEQERNPMLTTTYGVGQMILDALNKGCTTLLIGIGGSATNDCGMGMLSALGYEFYDSEDTLVDGSGGDLGKVERIVTQNADVRLALTKVIVACDVDNPLAGGNGAAYIYGPQKGASEAVVKSLDAGLIHFSDKIVEFLGKDVSLAPGAGAAGGLGAGLMAFLDAHLESGFEMVSEAIELASIIEKGDYDLIITGEGQMNHQTLNGKLPFGVAQLGKKYDVPVIGIVGALGEGYEPMLEAGMVSIFSIMNRPMSLETAFAESEVLLKDTIIRVIKLFGYNN